MELKPQHIGPEKGPVTAALQDIYRGMLRTDTWWALSWEEFSRRYRRAFLGIIWAVLSFVIFVMAILLFRAAVAQNGLGDQATYVIFGFLLFQLLSPMVLDASVVFSNAASWLKGALLPMSLFVFKSISLNLIVFSFNCFGAFLILIAFGYRFPPSAWMFIPAFLVTLVNALWVYFLLGPLLAKFRDGAQLLSATMRMAFFVTPILWIPVPGTLLYVVALVNPLTHFINIMRAPLIGAPLPVLSWWIVGAMTVAGLIAALLVFAYTRKKIIYWVI